MFKGTKTLGNNKALALESRGFVHKKEDVDILTHPHVFSRENKYFFSCK